MELLPPNYNKISAGECGSKLALGAGSWHHWKLNTRVCCFQILEYNMKSQSGGCVTYLDPWAEKFSNMMRGQLIDQRTLYCFEKHFAEYLSFYIFNDKTLLCRNSNQSKLKPGNVRPLIEGFKHLLKTATLLWAQYLSSHSSEPFIKLEFKSSSYLSSRVILNIT